MLASSSNTYRNIWFEAATVVAVAPPVEIPAGSVLRSALAGGLSCALSCSLMHPVDTIKVCYSVFFFFVHLIVFNATRNFGPITATLTIGHIEGYS
jgi:hypothetical protein